MKKEFFSTFEAAEICNVSPGSISRWINEGKIETSYTPGGHHRIKKEAVVGLLKTMQMPVPQQLRAGLGSVVAEVVAHRASSAVVVRLGMLAGRRAQAAQSGMAGGRVRRRYRPGARLVSIVIDSVGGDGWPGALSRRSDARVCRRRAGAQNVKVAR